MNTALPSGQCNPEFNQTVTRWDEAIPLGNGRMGALIWGLPMHSASLRIGASCGI